MAQQKPLRAALGKVGRALVKVGLPALGTAIGGPAGGIVAGTLGSLLGVDPADTDALKTAIASASPETLLRLREVEASVALAELETARNEADEATARHAADMLSDSRFSKLIRPLSLAVTLGAFLLLVAAGVAVPQDRVETVLGLLAVLGDILVAMIGFYFGGRTLEKGVARFGKR